MSGSGSMEHQYLVELLEETFDRHHEWFLDGGDNLFDTLAGVTNEQASIRVGGGCATLAAQVSHISFYIQVLTGRLTGTPHQNADWGEIWETVGAVDADEWAAIVAELRAEYTRVRELADRTHEWPNGDAFGVVLAIVTHSAYHLGEIRQALCTLR